MAEKIKHEALQEVLQGYLDPVQKKFQRELGTVPIGETGLTRRLWEVNYLAHYFAAISRFARHRFARNFTPTIQHELWTAQTAWTVEVLRLLDEKESKGKKGRKNLTIALYHDRLQDSAEVTKEQKTQERSLYLAITAYQELHKLVNFRNRRIFHLDLEECLANCDSTGNIEELTRLMVEWYSFSAGIVGEPKYVTQGAPGQARTSAKSIIRMMLDSIRYQVHRGYRQYPLDRYGWQSYRWSQDLIEAEEEKQGFALLERVLADMGKSGQEIHVEIVTDRSHGRPQIMPKFTFPDKSVETEFRRRFNETMEKASHAWRLKP